MCPDAEVVHRLEGRTRVRIPGKRNDAGYFLRVAEQLKALPGIAEVSANPVTGSLLMRHAAPFETIADFAERQQLFRLVKAMAPTTLQGRVEAGLQDASRNLAAVSGGELNLDGLLFLGLTGLALHQAIEGNIMAPAVTLMWYALSAARRKQGVGGKPGDAGQDDSS